MHRNAAREMPGKGRRFVAINYRIITAFTGQFGNRIPWHFGCQIMMVIWQMDERRVEKPISVASGNVPIFRRLSKRNSIHNGLDPPHDPPMYVVYWSLHKHHNRKREHKPPDNKASHVGASHTYRPTDANASPAGIRGVCVAYSVSGRGRWAGCRIN